MWHVRKNKQRKGLENFEGAIVSSVVGEDFSEKMMYEQTTEWTKGKELWKYPRKNILGSGTRQCPSIKDHWAHARSWQVEFIILCREGEGTP